MTQLVGVFDNAVGQGLMYGIAVLGVALAFRILRYPDLTADGSFMLGAVFFAWAALAGAHWAVALAAAAAAGAVAGAFTALIHIAGRVNRLLSGILTSMVAYSVAFRVLDGRPNVGLADRATLFTSAESADRAHGWTDVGLHPAENGVALMLAIIVGAALAVALGSEWGLVLRANGLNEGLVRGLGRRPTRYILAGLTLANALVALAGGVVVSRQGFADVNMGAGSVVTFIAALILGEELIRRLSPRSLGAVSGRVVAPIAGCLLYYTAYLAILHASIRGWFPVTMQPTDLRMLSAALIIVVVMLRSRQPNALREEAFPF